MSARQAARVGAVFAVAAALVGASGCSSAKEVRWQGPSGSETALRGEAPDEAEEPSPGGDVVAGGGSPYARHPETDDPNGADVGEAPRIAIPDVAALRAAAQPERPLPVPCRMAMAFCEDGRIIAPAPERIERLRAALEGDLVESVRALPVPSAPPTGEPLDLARLCAHAREVGLDVLLIQSVARDAAGGTVGLSIVLDARDAAVVSVVEQRTAASARPRDDDGGRAPEGASSPDEPPGRRLANRAARAL